MTPRACPHHPGSSCCPFPGSSLKAFQKVREWGHLRLLEPCVPPAVLYNLPHQGVAGAALGRGPEPAGAMGSGRVASVVGWAPRQPLHKNLSSCSEPASPCRPALQQPHMGDAGRMRTPGHSWTSTPSLRRTEQCVHFTTTGKTPPTAMFKGAPKCLQKIPPTSLHKPTGTRGNPQLERPRPRGRGMEESGWTCYLRAERPCRGGGGTQAPQLHLARPQAWGQVYHAHGETEARVRETHPRSEGASEPKCRSRTPMGWERPLPRLTSRRGLSGS